MPQHQVTCIVKRGDHYNPHERIEKLGAQGVWMMSEQAMIQSIESGGESYYTLVNGRRAEVVVATHMGRKYLKTTADGYSPDNLLALNNCAGCKFLG